MRGFRGDDITDEFLAKFVGNVKEFFESQKIREVMNEVRGLLTFFAWGHGHSSGNNNGASLLFDDSLRFD